MSLVDRFCTKFIVASNGCWLWKTPGTYGGFKKNGEKYYGRFKIAGKKYLAHRVSWTLFRGPVHSSMFVLHKCDDPRCVNPGHLFLGTRCDNNRDRDAKGRTRIARGERVGLAKLTWEKVRRIRARFAAGGSTKKALGEEFGVSDVAIAQVISRQTWSRTDDKL